MEPVEQTFKVFGNILEITPSAALRSNSIYEIRIKGLKALYKGKKLDTLNLKVVTELTPSYCSIEAINTLIEVFAIPEERLLYYIREASRYVDYIKGTAAVKSGATASFEVEQFVKTKVFLDALLKAYVEKALDSGTKGTLGEITFEISEEFGSIKDLIKLLQEELKKWEDALRGDVTGNTGDSNLNDVTRTWAQEG